MARILAIDYGSKSTGLAATDPLQIIVSPIFAVRTSELLLFLAEYLANEQVEKIVIGKPIHKDGTPTKLWDQINIFAKKVSKKFPAVAIDYLDEAFTSQEAKQIILKSGAKKRKRQNKALIDTVSAVLILQQYLGHI